MDNNEKIKTYNDDCKKAIITMPYRAKSVDSFEWVMGYLLQEQNNVGEILTYIQQLDGTKHLVWTNTISRFTGEFSKKGNPIWEFDVIKYHFGNDVAIIRFGRYSSCFDSTKTEHIGFYVDWEKYLNFRKDLGYWINMVDCEVVGNMFDKKDGE